MNHILWLVQGNEHGYHNTPSKFSLVCDQLGLPYQADKQLIETSNIAAAVSDREWQQ